jgi:cellulose synthase/poly-beta-1,6-N-acetylglucosamine synthase-like glycosyltransferase
MCNGANLAYEKKAFNDVGGFQGIDCIASGDDMLLMYKMYKAYPEGIGFVKHPHAIVRTLPAEDVASFMQQRIRWASKADKYEDKRLTLVLAFVYLWNAGLLGLFIAGFFHPVLWVWCIGLIVFKTLTELFFLWPVAKFFQKTRLLWQFFPAQFLHIPYIIVAGWLGKFGSYEWKSRKVS